MAVPNVAVIVPWRGGCSYREAAWRFISRNYADRHPGWEVVRGVHESGQWCKAAAVSDGLLQTKADVLLIADADVWCDRLADAVDAVVAGADWAMPHGKIYRLDEASTAAVLAGGPMQGTTVERIYYGYPGGGFLALARETYCRSPFDPRFVGWGYEDQSIALALRTFHGEPWRGDTPLFHLWHPPQERPNRREGSRESRYLFRRYRQVANDPARMRALIEEAPWPH